MKKPPTICHVFIQATETRAHRHTRRRKVLRLDHLDDKALEDLRGRVSAHRSNAPARETPKPRR